MSACLSLGPLTTWVVQSGTCVQCLGCVLSVCWLCVGVASTLPPCSCWRMWRRRRHLGGSFQLLMPVTQTGPRVQILSPQFLSISVSQCQRCSPALQRHHHHDGAQWRRKRRNSSTPSPPCFHWPHLPDGGLEKSWVPSAVIWAPPPSSPQRLLRDPNPTPPPPPSQSPNASALAPVRQSNLSYTILMTWAALLYVYTAWNCMWSHTIPSKSHTKSVNSKLALFTLHTDQPDHQNNVSTFVLAHCCHLRTTSEKINMAVLVLAGFFFNLF